MKKCTKHSQYFPNENNMFPATEEYFCRCRAYSDGLQGWCRKCIRENNRRYFSTLKGKLCLMYFSIKRRCNNPDYSQYRDYGGRGIQNLFKSKKAFIDYIMNDLGIVERSQLDGLVLDRIDNNGHYEPGNLRFVTHSESQYNRRNCKNLKI